MARTTSEELAPERAALAHAIRGALHWSFWAGAWVGVPAVTVIATLGWWQGRRGVALWGLPAVFFAGMAVFAAARGRWTLAAGGRFLAAWLVALAVVAQINDGPGGGSSVTWMAAACLALLFIGSRWLLGVVAALSATYALQGGLCLAGVIPPPGERAALLHAGPWLGLWVGLVAGIGGLGYALRAFLDLLASAYVRELAERRRREAAEEQRRAMETALAAHQNFVALGRAAAGVAHDVNNALTVVLGNGSLLRGPMPEGVRAELHDDLEQAVRAAAQTTRQLLGFSPDTVCRPCTLEPAAVTRQLERAFRRLLPENLRLSLVLSTDRTVVADPTELQRALLNLLLNARDAMPRGGELTIEVAAAALADGRPAVAIAVRDTGCGLSDEVRARIFEPFFTTKSPGLGTGLGLPLVRQFAEDCGGRIDVASAPGAGATFTLVLPAGAGPDVTEPEVMFLPAALSGRVLLVEDRPEVRRTCARLLARGGFTVTVAADGDEALARIGAARFDLLCTDAVLPGPEAVVVVDRFRRENPTGRVVVCAGSVVDPALAEAARAGQLAVLPKPFTAAALLATAEAQLRLRTAA